MTSYIRTLAAFLLIMLDLTVSPGDPSDPKSAQMVADLRRMLSKARYGPS
jgi:hypothetical protein